MNEINKVTVRINGSDYSIVGPKEGEGPLGDYFDEILNDDLFGKDSFEKAESEMLYTAITSAINRANINEEDVVYNEKDIKKEDIFVKISLLQVSLQSVRLSLHMPSALQSPSAFWLRPSAPARSPIRNVRPWNESRRPIWKRRRSSLSRLPFPMKFPSVISLLA